MIYNGIDIVELGESLEDYEYKSLPVARWDLVVHHYEAGDYDGSGYLIGRIGDKWYFHDMGHCSCYGPLDRMSLSSSYNSLEELKAKCSKDIWHNEQFDAVLRWLEKQPATREGGITERSQ